MHDSYKICLRGEKPELAAGLALLQNDLPFTLSADGLPVYPVQCDELSLSVKKNSGGATITYRRPIHFFRAFGLLLEKLPGGGDFELTEPILFDANGAMFDVSQGNSVINVDHVRFFLRKMAVMGLNLLMLYTEDNYDVKEWPYFGYMRSRYSQADLKELDDYADALGIELVPCIQTLAHLIDALKWPCFAGMRDDEDTLLVGEDKVYTFIEQMILAATTPLRSKRIHIGMDEAWRLGQGMYLLKNGYKDKGEIMLQHLERVMAITDRLGLKPMIWSDMFFRAASQTGDYYDQDLAITQTIIDRAPKNLQLVYWDYYHPDQAFYLDWIRRHKQFGAPPVFAGGIWTWTSFGANWSNTLTNTQAALAACKKEQVREVFATIWGDDSTECPIDINLLGLQVFAEHGYALEPDPKKLADRFFFTTGARLDDLLKINRFDAVPGTEDGNARNFNASKVLMWQDILGGLFDKDIEGLPLNSHYAGLAAEFEQLAGEPSGFQPIYEFYRQLACTLAIKAELGLQIKAAYDRRDKPELARFAGEVLPDLLARVLALKNCHRAIWLKNNKPLGWETYDLRYGFLMNRIDTAISRLDGFCAGELDRIGELDEERRHYWGKPCLTERNNFALIASASRFSFYTTAVYPM